MSREVEPPPPGEVAALSAERAFRPRTAPELLDHAQKLRREMTRQERRLWYDFLRTYPVKWYKQRPAGGYILDFYCHEARLAVELDGGQHYEEAGQNYESERTANLAHMGITILRFSNPDADRNFDGVCETIHLALKAKASPRGGATGTGASPLGGGGICIANDGEGLPTEDSFEN